jgi:hypothetical protein
VRRNHAYALSAAVLALCGFGGWQGTAHTSDGGYGQAQAVSTAVAQYRWHPKPVPVPTATKTTPPPVVTPTTPAPAASTTTAAAPTGNGTKPLPAALAGHPLVTTFSPAALASAPWKAAANNPGGCQSNQAGVALNSAGYAQLTTTGTDCVDIQSPSTVPTKPGYVYEAKIFVSNANNWASDWMYGDKWPDQGEIDAVEFNYAASFVTWHQAGNATKGDAAWDGQQLPTTGPRFTAGAWHTVDISFTSSGVDVYYDGVRYISVPESVTTAGTDPMWLTFSTSGCAAGGYNECASGAGNQPGNLQVQYVSEFS